MKPHPSHEWRGFGESGCVGRCVKCDCHVLSYDAILLCNSLDPVAVAEKTECVGHLWGVNQLGGYTYSRKLSDILRTAIKPLSEFREFCDAKDFTDKDLHTGLLTWNVQGVTVTKTSTINETDLKKAANEPEPAAIDWFGLNRGD